MGLSGASRIRSGQADRANTRLEPIVLPERQANRYARTEVIENDIFRASIVLSVTELRDRSLFDELSEVDRADLLRTVIRLHAVLERRMIAVGLNPSRCRPKKGRAQGKLSARQLKDESGSWNGKRQVELVHPRQKKKWGIQIRACMGM